MINPVTNATLDYKITNVTLDYTITPVTNVTCGIKITNVILDYTRLGIKRWAWLTQAQHRTRRGKP